MPRFLLLVLPSVSSGALTAAGALVILVASGWSYINNNQLFYDQLFGIYGFKTSLLQSNSLYALQHALLDSTYTYYVLLVTAGVTVGLIVFTLLEAVRRTALTTAEEIHQIEDPDPTHKAAAREALERLLLRVAALIGWGVYVAVFTTIILPFTVISSELGIDAFSSSRLSGFWYCGGAFLLLTAGLHMHLVFARLCVLRPRLFGDTDIEVAKYRQL